MIDFLLFFSKKCLLHKINIYFFNRSPNIQVMKQGGWIMQKYTCAKKSAGQRSIQRNTTTMPKDLYKEIWGKKQLSTRWLLPDS